MDDEEQDLVSGDGTGQKGYLHRARPCVGNLTLTPSIRLLSLVHEGLKSRLGWIPWQYRLSVKQYQEIHEAKTQRPWRSEMQLLAHAFVDDTPEIN